MDSFPEDLNRKTSVARLKSKQAQIIKDTRKLFTDSINEKLNDGKVKKIELDFPEELWYENRLIITKELMKLYEELKLVTYQGGSIVSMTRNKDEDIPKYIDRIIIELINDKKN